MTSAQGCLCRNPGTGMLLLSVLLHNALHATHMWSDNLDIGCQWLSEWLGFNSLVPGRFKINFSSVIFNLILVVNGWGISCETALIWMSLDYTYNKSTLVQVMAWCRQATSHYLSQCWPRSLSPYVSLGHNELIVLNLKQLDHFFQSVILFSNVIAYKWNCHHAFNWSNTMNI